MMLNGIKIWLAMTAASASQIALSADMAQPGSSRARSRLEQVSLHLDRFDLRVLARGREVWHGRLEVNRMDAARYTQTRIEAVRPPCATLKPGLDRRDELELQINKDGGNVTDPDEYRFVILWNRAVPDADCSRAVTTAERLEDHVRLDAGQAIVLDDGGELIVEIRRLR